MQHIGFFSESSYYRVVDKVTDIEIKSKSCCIKHCVRHVVHGEGPHYTNLQPVRTQTGGALPEGIQIEGANQWVAIPRVGLK